MNDIVSFQDTSPDCTIDASAQCKQVEGWQDYTHDLTVQSPLKIYSYLGNGSFWKGGQIKQTEAGYIECIGGSFTYSGGLFNYTSTSGKFYADGGCEFVFSGDGDLDFGDQLYVGINPSSSVTSGSVSFEETGDNVVFVNPTGIDVWGSTSSINFNEHLGTSKGGLSTLATTPGDIVLSNGATFERGGTGSATVAVWLPVFVNTGSYFKLDSTSQGNQIELDGDDNGYALTNNGGTVSLGDGTTMKTLNPVYMSAGFFETLSRSAGGNGYATLNGDLVMEGGSLLVSYSSGYGTFQANNITVNGGSLVLYVDSTPNDNCDFIKTTGDLTVNSGGTVRVNTSGTPSSGYAYLLLQAGGTLSQDFTVSFVGFDHWDQYNSGTQWTLTAL
jgi:hypothetical protein